MAGLPLNTFKNIPRVVTDTSTKLYNAPLGVTTIVLMAQVSNVGNATEWVTFVHKQHRSPQLQTTVVFQAPIPPNDARVLLSGKLVLESLDEIWIQGSSNDNLQFIASILETANQ